MSETASSNLTKKLLVYGVSAGAASLAASAKAAIISSGPISVSGFTVYFDPVADTFSNTAGTSTSFELSTTPVEGYEYLYGDGEPAGSSKAIAPSGGGIASGAAPDPFAPSVSSALELTPGAVIGGNQTFTTPTTMNDYLPILPPGEDFSGPWYPGDSGYLGLEINVGGDSSNAEHSGSFTTSVSSATDYGYAAVTYNDDGSFTLTGFTYDDSGASVTIPVPEPSTVAMLVAGAGAAGVAAWRRRHKRSARF